MDVEGAAYPAGKHLTKKMGREHRGMSMPEFPNDLTREKALDTIIASIALEEAALSHIINAEGEKIQYILRHASGGSPRDIQNVLAINNSAAQLLERINEMQIVLKSKLRAATESLAESLPTTPDEPTGPTGPPEPPPEPPAEPKPIPIPPPISSGESVFAVVTDYNWAACSTLRLDCVSRRGGVSYSRKNCESRICLPMGRSYKIDIFLRIINQIPCPVTIEARLFNEDETVCSKQLLIDANKCRAGLNHRLIWEAPLGRGGCYLTVRLVSPAIVRLAGGGITITELA
jgi:hypothetical protein